MLPLVELILHFSLFATVCVAVPHPRIWGGELVDIQKVPYQVYFRKASNNELRASGAIIHKHFAVTNAHIMFLLWNSTDVVEPNYLKLYAGSTDLDNPNAVHELSEIFVHEKYYHPAFYVYHDIALVKTKTEIAFSDAIQPIKLPAAGVIIPDGTALYSSGWGHTDFGYPDHLQRAVFKSFDHKECRRLHPTVHDNSSFVTSDVICAYNSLVASCGTGGEPLTLGEGRDAVLIGIEFLSGYIYCQPNELPVTFQRIPAYRKWIDSKLKDYL